MIEQPLSLAATLAAITALGFLLERRFAWARRLGASLLVIGLGALLSNLGLVPASSPIYSAIWGPVTSLAIVWLLFAVDLRDLRAAGPRMVGAFALGVAGTAAGAMAAAALFSRTFGDQSFKLAGVMTGTYAGGSLNFIAVGRALDLPEATFAAATAADNLLTALWMGATLMLPLWLAPFFPTQSPSTERTAGEAATGLATESRFKPFDFLALLALGLALIRVAEAIAARLPGIPAVLWLTTLALFVGALPAVKRLEGAMAFGLVALNLLFAVIGIGSRVADIAAQGPAILYFTLMVVAVHGTVIYGGARLLGIDLATASVASQAAVGGPSTAVALAAARGWPRLALPGMAVGLLGYAVGNYAGLAVAALMRRLLGG